MERKEGWNKGGRMERLDVVEVAKLLRQELKREFPSIKFSVKIRRFSGSESIDIYWKDGPATEKVEQITKKYAIKCPYDDFAYIRSVHCNRDYTDEVFERFKEQVKSRFAEGTFGDWDDDPNFRSIVWQEIYKTSFEPPKNDQSPNK